MRLLVLPLTKKHSILYCQNLLLPLVRPKPRIHERLIKKAGETWGRFQTSEKRWKQVIVKCASFLMDRIPYEEWGLKTIPATNHLQRHSHEKNRHVATKEARPEELEPVSVVFPHGIMTFQDAITVLKKHAHQGGLKQLGYMGLCFAGLPLTAPIAVNPFIPNLPAFYLMYRMYSHWCAFQGARHLLYLLKHQQLRPESLGALEVTYDDFSRLEDARAERLFRIFECFELEAAIKRAVNQLKRRKEW